MTITNTLKTTTTLANDPARAALLDLAKAVKAHGSRMDTLVKPLVKIGVKADDLKGGGKYYADLKDATAQAYLTPAQYKVFADETLSTTKTKRGEYMKRVSSQAAKVRAEIVKAMAAPAAKRGAGSKATPTEVFFKTVDTYVQRFGKEDASDRFDFDPLEARAALVAMLKTLR